MTDGPNPGQSYEAWIESKAGACPPEPDYPTSLPVWGDPDTSEDEWYAEQRAAQEILDRRDRGDWPMPSPPPFPADDEDDEAPDE